MKIIHKPDIDYLSIDFKDGVEAKSEYQDGIIVRYDKKGNVIGIDITDSKRLFSSKESLGIKDACKFLQISESTIRRMIKNKKIKYTKKGRAYQFKKSDLIKFVA